MSFFQNEILNAGAGDYAGAPTLLYAISGHIALNANSMKCGSTVLQEGFSLRDALYFYVAAIAYVRIAGQYVIDGTPGWNAIGMHDDVTENAWGIKCDFATGVCL